MQERGIALGVVMAAHATCGPDVYNRNFIGRMIGSSIGDIGARLLFGIVATALIVFGTLLLVGFLCQPFDRETRNQVPMTHYAIWGILGLD